MLYWKLIIPKVTQYLTALLYINQTYQDLRCVEESFEDPMLVCTPGSVTTPGTAAARAAGAGGARLAATLTIDYYNRTLSGWEPVVEPWR